MVYHEAELGNWCPTTKTSTERKKKKKKSPMTYTRHYKLLHVDAGSPPANRNPQQTLIEIQTKWTF